MATSASSTNLQAPPPLLIVMGVTGTGKSTVGAQLAKRLPQPSVFIDGDDLHPAGSISKMASGTALTDQDRIPWLHAARRACLLRLGLGEEGDEESSQAKHVVLACSALTRTYRSILMGEENKKGGEFPPSHVGWVFLTAEESVLRERMQQRSHHFMPTHLLASQLALLEAPTRAEVGEKAFLIQVNVGKKAMSSPEAVTETVVQALRAWEDES
ncbi:MAG: P-loop containing nucleoside triphosphate hydrolase protein [Piptocephalis tieghemiana]|nr:MAG: P-loop containing nucleoside triphosphate hydrolase protein [Piptocephalis tieghemiana]